MTTNERRIFGPPGTGKTTRLAEWIRQVASTLGSESVLVSSMTRTAAAELVGRDLPLDRDQIGTLHAHCYRALGKPGLAETRIDEFNTAHPTLSVASKASLDEALVDQVTKTTGDQLMQRYQLLRGRMVSRDQWSLATREFATAWERWKNQVGVLDFTDLLEVALRDLDTPPKHATVGFFDEAQDFNQLQFSLIRRWSERMQYVVLAGDDDQTLYSWSGASPDAFLTPIEERAKVVLQQSYRVPAAVCDYAQSWIQQVRRREPKHYLPRHETSDLASPVAVGEVTHSRASIARAEQVIDQVETVLADGKSVMLLTSCSYQLEPLIAVLRKRALPFGNIYRRTRGDWNPLAHGNGVSMSERILAYLRPEPTVWQDDARIWNVEDARKFLDIVRADGLFKRGAKKALESMDAKAELDLGWFLRWLEDPAQFDQIFRCDLSWLRAHALASKSSTLEFPLRVAEQRGALTLRQAPKITVGTIHSVKGGEADTVFLFPDLSRPAMQEWLAIGEGRDSIVRQFYVGMTRARETLVLCSPSSPQAITFPRYERKVA